MPSTPTVRLLRLVVIFTATGALASVFLAWASAYIAQMRAIAPMAIDRNDSAAVAFENEFDITLRGVSGSRVRQFGYDDLVMCVIGHGRMPSDLFQRTYYSDDMFDWTESVHFTVQEVRAGWPFHSFQQRVVEEFPDHLQWLNRCMVGPGVRTIRGVTMPLSPIWQGAILSTVFYSIVFFAMLMLWRWLRSIRRHFRQRRGCCPSCAYPMGASDLCTECGEMLPLEARQTAALRKGE